jgi:hypothetical protein
VKEKSSRVAKGKSADAEPGSAVKKKGAAGGAETLKLKWTKEARLQIFPKRGYPYEGYEPPRDPDRLLRLMRKRYSGYQHELRSDLAEGDAKKLMKAVKPFMNNAEDPGEVDSEAAAAVLLGINEVHPYVQEERAPFWIADYWVALKGCAFALQRQLLIDGSDFDNYPSVDWKAEGFMLFMAGGTYAPHLVRSTVFAKFDSNLPYGYVPDRKCTAVFIIADDGTPLDHRERPITFKTNSAVMIPSPYQDYPGNLRAMAKIFKRLNRNLLFGAFKAPD